MTTNKQTALVRCEWCGDDEQYQKYHDEEWGVPVHDDLALFEMLLLEGAQAGLSWITVLRKRQHYRKVFDGFNPEKMAEYDSRKIANLLNDAGIIRNKLKVNAFIVNAQLYLKMQAKAEKGRCLGFSDYLWSFVSSDGTREPIINQRKAFSDIPAKTDESEAMAKALNKLGFKFVGATICYAFMQATGMVNDHVVDCHRYAQKTS